MKTQKQKTGDLGEEIVVDYLRNNGYKILERNYKRKYGEIDIIALCHSNCHRSVIMTPNSCQSNVSNNVIDVSQCHSNVSQNVSNVSGIGHNVIDVTIEKLLNKYKKNAILTFFEVKTGVAGNLFRAEENVHSYKKRRLIKTVQTYLLENRLAPDMNWQIDVVIVELDFNNCKADLRHIKNAVY